MKAQLPSLSLSWRIGEGGRRVCRQHTTPSLRSGRLYLLTMLMSRYKVTPLGYDEGLINKGLRTPMLAKEPLFNAFVRSSLPLAQVHVYLR